jgi:cell wall-associated NlpC family hydrolase
VNRALPVVLLLLLAGCASTAPAPVDMPSASAERAAANAAKMVGKPYRYASASPSRGFDCSGLVHYSYAQAGVSVPRSTEEQLRASRPVRGSMRPGDLLFFDQEGKKKSHVGIYLGNGRFVHAPSSGKRVRTDSLESRYWKTHLAEVRRL